MVSEQALRDRIGWHSAAAIRAPAFKVLDRIQHLDPSLQVTAVAVALCAMAETLGLRMRDVINVAERTLADAEGPYTESIQAIRAYAKHELLRRGE